MDINPEYTRPKPFATVLELIDEYSLTDVLQSLADFAEFESENEDICNDCSESYAALSSQLSELAQLAGDECEA
jgi:hypothetical protein